MGRGLRDCAKWLKNTPFHPQWLIPARAVDSVITQCSGVVLDIGAADGWLKGLIGVSADYISLDYPSTAIGLYRTRPDVFGDACRLPFTDSCIDAIACYEVMEHVKNPEEALSEIARVLAPNGVVELSMPFLYPIHDAPHDYQRWTRYGFLRRLDDVGLDVVGIELTNHSLHAAAALVCLSLAGPLQGASIPSLLWRLPLALLLVPTVNISARLVALAWPRWDAMSTGYRVLARKRS